MIKLTRKQMVQIWSNLKKKKNTPNTWYNFCVLWFAVGVGQTSPEDHLRQSLISEENHISLDLGKFPCFMVSLSTIQ